MIDVRQWTWKLDLQKMTCFNEENSVMVRIGKEGHNFKGKILDMSGDLFWEIAKNEDGPKIVQEIALAAEDEYCRANCGYEMLD